MAQNQKGIYFSSLGKLPAKRSPGARSTGIVKSPLSPTTSVRPVRRVVSVQSSSFRIELFLGAPFIALARSLARTLPRRRPAGTGATPSQSPTDPPTDRAHKKASSRFKPRLPSLPPLLSPSLLCSAVLACTKGVEISQTDYLGNGWNIGRVRWKTER